MLSNRFQLPADSMQKLIVLAETGKSKVALKNAKQFEKLYPNDPALKNFIGVVYASTGNGDLAAKTFSKLIKSSPSYIPAYTNLANFFSQKLAYQDAIKILMEAIKVNEEIPDIYIDLGTNYQMNGELESAIASFHSALALSPKHVRAWINLGNVLWENGQPKLAADAYLEALNIMPENTTVASYLIDTLHFVPMYQTGHSPYVKANCAIKNMGSTYDLHKFVSYIPLCNFLIECNKIIKGNKLSIEYKNTQIYRMPAKVLNCERHKSIFANYGVIPKFCFGCIKIQIDVFQVVDLVRLFLFFDRLDFLSQNIRKCMIEMRDGVKGRYKGLVYCSSLAEAESLLQKLRRSVENALDCQPNFLIKRGCTEFEQAFPGFSDVVCGEDKMMSYNRDWERVENIWDLKHSKRSFVPSATLPGISLADVLIIKNWFAYGQKIGDKTAEIMEL